MRKSANIQKEIIWRRLSYTRLLQMYQNRFRRWKNPRGYTFKKLKERFPTWLTVGGFLNAPSFRFSTPYANPTHPSLSSTHTYICHRKRVILQVTRTRVTPPPSDRNSQNRGGLFDVLTETVRTWGHSQPSDRNSQNLCLPFAFWQKITARTFTVILCNSGGGTFAA